MVNIEASSFPSDSLYKHLELTFWSSRPEVTSNRVSPDTQQLFLPVLGLWRAGDEFAPEGGGSWEVGSR